MLYFQKSAIIASTGLFHAFSTRKADDIENISLFKENGDIWEKLPSHPLFTELGMAGLAPFLVKQIHSGIVMEITEQSTPQTTNSIQADAMITAIPNRALIIRTADCLPVIAISSNPKAVGIAHAGWRGICAGVLQNMLKVMRDAYNIESTSLQIIFGPAIRQVSYQVGEEVIEAYLKAYPDDHSCYHADSVAGKYRFSLQKAAIHQLTLVGVRTDNIHDLEIDTAKHVELCYSYRREGQNAGRMLSMVWML